MSIIPFLGNMSLETIVSSTLSPHMLSAFAGFVLPPGSTSIFNPAGTPAPSIFSLSMLVLSITGGVFVVVGGLLLYALLRYRHRAKDPGSNEEPQQIYGSTQ